MVCHMMFGLSLMMFGLSLMVHQMFAIYHMFRLWWLRVRVHGRVRGVGG